MHKTHNALLHALNAGIEQIIQLPEEVYLARAGGPEGDTYGGHWRHALSMCQVFLEEYPSSMICYGNRKRDLEVENQRVAGITKGQAVWDALFAMPLKEKWLTVRGERGEVFATSIGRELEYLYTHTIHHEAIMRIILQQHGIAHHPHFGIAPSTLRASLDGTNEPICKKKKN